MLGYYKDPKATLDVLLRTEASEFMLDNINSWSQKLKRARCQCYAYIPQHVSYISLIIGFMTHTTQSHHFSPVICKLFILKLEIF
jgi:hypothetical protein